MRWGGLIISDWNAIFNKLFYITISQAFIAIDNGNVISVEILRRMNNAKEKNVVYMRKSKNKAKGG